VAGSRAPGLRTQIVLALAGLMLLAFVPMFFAVASLTRATLRGVREQAARALGRAVAAHVADANKTGDIALLRRRLESDVGQGGVEAVAIYDAGGHLLAQAGDADELGAMRPPALPYGEAAVTVRGTNGRALDVVVPEGGAVVVARLRTDDDADQAAPLVRLVALYMTTFAFALLVFAYFALTRLIVRPIEALARAADRVASGARTLHVPRAGAHEVVELGQSVQAMTAHLIADDAALRTRLEELTLTTKHLTETRTQLARSDRLASVGRLAAGIAHEIGNPLTAIMGIQDLMLGDGLTDEQRDFVARMKRETERIHTVLRDLLDFARPEGPAESTGGPVQPADVRRVIEDVVALLKPQKVFREVEIKTELLSGDLRVVLSSPRLTQVLLNMMLNAGDALASSGRTAGRVLIRCASSGKNVKIEVEDNGPGIAPTVVDRLFEPFATTKDIGEGTGLGLAVCRGIVESAGGEIAVDESYVAGARLVVTLPATAPPAPER
jgi:two-component system NtrC family sensor kinase